MPQNLLLILDIFFQLYLAQAEELTLNDDVLLQTLSFYVSVAHPHAHIVRCFDLVKGECLDVTTE
jgi:hypothetical protein